MLASLLAGVDSSGGKVVLVRGEAGVGKTSLVREFIGRHDQGVKVPRGRAHSTRQHALGLTARQAEVLQLLAEGLTNPEIADRLFVAPRTVQHHVSAVLSKLHATTRQDAVTQAHKKGPPTPSN